MAYSRFIVVSPGGIRIRVVLADSWYSRYRGLKNATALQWVDGIILLPCASIHTFGMQGPIDAYFLDEHNKILKIVIQLLPRRFAWAKGATCVLEVKPGNQFKPLGSIGDQLILLPVGQ